MGFLQARALGGGGTREGAPRPLRGGCGLGGLRSHPPEGQPAGGGACLRQRAHRGPQVHGICSAAHHRRLRAQRSPCHAPRSAEPCTGLHSLIVATSILSLISLLAQNNGGVLEREGIVKLYSQA